MKFHEFVGLPELGNECQGSRDKTNTQGGHRGHYLSQGLLN